MKRKHISTIFIILIFLVGLGFISYPTVSNLWNQAHQSRAIATYSKQVEKLDDSENKKMLKAARKYNKSLLKKSDHWKLSKKDKKKYESLLDVSGTGIMGYIEVPKIDCSLPIYHGTDEGALQIAIGHLEGCAFRAQRASKCQAVYGSGPDGGGRYFYPEYSWQEACL